MPFVLAFIILAIFAYSQGYIKDKNDSPNLTPANTRIETAAPNYVSDGKAPYFYLDTNIVAAPAEGETLSQIKGVVFEFSGATSLSNQKISFETKIEGLDKDWQSTDSGKRTVNFPAESKQYTFLVRAKIGEYKDQTPAKRTFQVQVSPYFGKIKISSASSDSVNFNVYNLAESEKVNITGWKLKNGRGGEFLVPQGIELYPGISAPNENIFIKKNDQIYVKNSNGPFILNKAFRPNKCFGYLRLSYGPSFPFSYSKICPAINRSEICNFSQDCQNAVLQLQNCNYYDNSRLSSITYDSLCQSYMENYASRYLNYAGCVGNYLKDGDFFAASWYIFAGQSLACKCGKDSIYFYDKNGYLVDKYDYESY